MRTKMKIEVPAEEDQRDQYMKTIILQKCSKLVREQSAPQVDMEPFEGNRLDFTYFMSIIQESVEKNIDDLKGEANLTHQIHQRRTTRIGQAFHK